MGSTSQSTLLERRADKIKPQRGLDVEAAGRSENNGTGTSASVDSSSMRSPSGETTRTFGVGRLPPIQESSHMVIHTPYGPVDRKSLPGARQVGGGCGGDNN